MSDRIEDLTSETAELCRKHLLACERAGVRLRVTHTLRTMNEQTHLYAKGRTIASGIPCSCKRQPCKIHPLGATVTNAKAGKSAHNYGLAYDVCFVERFDPPEWRKLPPYPKEESLWQLIGRLGHEVGLDWGGPLGADDTFTFDRPHFQRLKWRKLARGE